MRALPDHSSLPYLLVLIIGQSGLYFLILGPHISVPLFWDEIGVFGRGIFQMIDNGVGLHPKLIRPEISRGHPLLFTFVYASVAKVFGEHIAVLRICSLLISMSTILAMYWAFSGIVKNKFVLSLSCLAIISQPVFIAHSIMILPEMLLSLFLILALGSYLKKKYILYSIFAAFSVMVKETGLVFIFGITVFGLLWSLIYERKINYRLTAFSFVSIVPYLLFLQVQKETYGWYLFPYHSGGFKLESQFICNNLTDFLQFLFLEQGRRFYSLAALLVLIISLISKTGQRPKLTKAGAVIFCTSIFYLLFYASCYYMNRYILVLVALLVFSLALLFYCSVFSMLSKHQMILSASMFIFFAAAQAKYLKGDGFNYDEDLGFIHFVEAQKEAVDYVLEREILNDKFYVNFPLDVALLDSRYGFIQQWTGPYFNTPISEETKNIVTLSPPTSVDNPQELPLVLENSWNHEFVEIRHEVIETGYGELTVLVK